MIPSVQICVVTTKAHGVGGMQRHTHELVRGLVEAGHEVDVVCPADPELGPNLHGARWHLLDAPSNFRDPAWQRASSAELARLSRDRRFDVIHAEGSSGLGLLRNAPSPHLPLAVKFHGNYLGLLKAGLRRAYRQPVTAPMEARQLLALSRKHFARGNATGFRRFEAMVPSRQQLTDTRRSHRLDPRRLHVVPNGVDTSFWHPRERASRNGPVLVASGRLERDKGFDVALRALGSLDAKLVIAGSGPAQDMLEQLAESLGVADRVDFVGAKTPAEMAEIVAAADVYLFPTIREEAAPLVLPEAMACGVPVIASRIGGIPEVIDRPGVNGMLVSPGQRRGARCCGVAPARRRRAAAFDGGGGTSAHTRGVHLGAHDRAHRRRLRAGGGRGVNDTEERRRPRVAVLGPTAQSRGGVASTVRTLVSSPLTERFELVVIPTQVDGTRSEKLAHSLGGLGRLFRLALTRRIDLVHLHASTGPSFARKVAAVAIARLLRVPVVFHAHGGGFHAQLRRTGPRGWIGRRALRLVLARADAVIALTPGWAAELGAHARIRRLAVVANVPELPIRVERSENGARGEPVVLYLGHLYRAKGVYDLLNAFVRLHADRPNLRLILAGEGVEHDALREHAVRAGLVNGSVELPGWIGPEEKARLLASARCLVLPSYGEGLPLVVLEAMLAGTPVVATSVGGIPETVTDGVEGLLVPVGDEDALTEAIGRVVDDPALGAELAARAAERVQTDYSAEAFAQRVGALYDELLSERRRPPARD